MCRSPPRMVTLRGRSARRRRGVVTGRIENRVHSKRAASIAECRTRNHLTLTGKTRRSLATSFSRNHHTPIASMQWMRVTHHPSTNNPERLILKLNLPVVDVEYQIHDHTMIVSKTDIKGKITYINDQFIEVSGFSEAELLD